MTGAVAAMRSAEAAGLMQERAQGQQGGGIQLDPDQIVREPLHVPGAGGVHLAAVAQIVFPRPRLRGPVG